MVVPQWHPWDSLDSMLTISRELTPYSNPLYLYVPPAPSISTSDLSDLIESHLSGTHAHLLTKEHLCDSINVYIYNTQMLAILNATCSHYIGYCEFIIPSNVNILLVHVSKTRARQKVALDIFHHFFYLTPFPLF